MLDVGNTAARFPMLVNSVFVWLAQRRNQQTGFLHFAPREILVSECAHKTLHRFQPFVALAGGGARAWHEAPTLGCACRLRTKALGQAVFFEYLEKPLGIVRPVAEIGHHPASILGVHDGGRRRNAFARMAARLALHHRVAHHPGHQVNFRRNRHRLMHGTR